MAFLSPPDPGYLKVSASQNHTRSNINLFNVPELSELYSKRLVDYMQKGQQEIKVRATELYAKLIFFNYLTKQREELIQVMVTTFAESKSSFLRKTFADFCLFGCQELPQMLFKEHFQEKFIALGNDKVPNVRLQFCKTLGQIKQLLDCNVDTNLEIFNILNELKNDTDKDV